MSADGITLDADMTNCAADYGRRCESIGKERRNPQDLDDAMRHPNFKAGHHELLDRLAKEYRASLPLLERPARWTIRGGGYKSKQDLVKTVKGNDHEVTDWAMGVVNNKEFVLMKDGDEYDVFQTTVKELTGLDQVKTPELYAAQYRLGFCDAPFETALLVLVEYTDQPMDTWEYALSKPLAVAFGCLDVLDVVRYSGGSCVGSSYADPDVVWRGRDRLLVCRKRP